MERSLSPGLKRKLYPRGNGYVEEKTSRSISVKREGGSGMKKKMKRPVPGSIKKPKPAREKPGPKGIDI